MDKEMALKDATGTFERTLVTIEEAQKICNRVDSLLPQGWHSQFWRGDFLEFCPLYPHKASSAEFRTVCDLVEKVTGRKLGRRASGTKGNPKLIASNHSNFGNDTWLTLWVESRADDDCKITYKRTWETKAIADENCLGASRQNGVSNG